MKKIFLIIPSILLLVIVTFASITYITCFYSAPVGSNSITINKEQNTLTTSKESVKILQLTDLQFSTIYDQAKAFNLCKKVIKKSSPNLIVLTGDIMSDNSKKIHLNNLIRFMDGFKIPWAIVFGNHDYNSKVSPSELSKAYQNAKFGIYKEGDISNSYGNYCYNLQFNSSNFALIFMDSKVDGFEREQVIWYEKQLTDLQQVAGQMPLSFAFFHIPPKQTTYVIQEYLNGNLQGSGVVNETVCAQTTQSYFYEKVYELGSTQALFYGHDHINTAIVSYNGITFAYGVKTGKTSYYDSAIQGANLITLNQNGTFLIDRIFI